MLLELQHLLICTQLWYSTSKGNLYIYHYVHVPWPWRRSLMLKYLHVDTCRHVEGSNVLDASFSSFVIFIFLVYIFCYHINLFYLSEVGRASYHNLKIHVQLKTTRDGCIYNVCKMDVKNLVQGHACICSSNFLRVSFDQLSW